MRSLFVFLLLVLSLVSEAQKKQPAVTSTVSFDQAVYSGLRWRELGPFRGGRSCTVTGVPGQPNLYYFGTVG
ncbi:MAG: hypothetical protein ACK5WO_09110, partial [Cyclobacteriaceae bacterium]